MGDEATLFERIGGEPAMARILDEFYARVLDDPELGPFFRHASMDSLRRMQLEFLGAALDGPLGYSGLALSHAHQGRGITARHFNRFTQHFLETLRARGVGEAEVVDVIARINTYADDIVGRSAVSE
ncbi:group I truncated hemoglobin [Tautonia plasticadhaerens]|uniref:Group 1 truncated hemoglobin GlbN n=1 Tax=Tautonia plasticadhaerens TaxID=2527974 RepID=A0A518H6L3_9BACT|nr:group 1 truncated hemoglobin [Tautonia plasticadhaerens]QDV36499.1 Group 1 truncated hemoglobin GlbN [Tautonia plasticadhaerens]